jgi:SAM-dependent methyltransferase
LAVEQISQNSEEHSAARPLYPDDLYAGIALNSPALTTAWDCACGNGKAAIGLARFLRRVKSTDLSGQQIMEPKVQERAYRVMATERIVFPVDSLTALLLRRLLHWFDFASWWRELSRIARTGALFVTWVMTDRVSRRNR